MGRTFRSPSSVRNFGWLALIGFSCVSVSSAFFSLELPAEKRLLFLLLADGISLSMVGLSLWLLLIFYRERLSLDDAGISKQGVLGGCRIAWNEVTSLVWGERPHGGRAVVKSSSARLAIPFENFTRPERLLLIRRLRSAVPDDVQTNWPLFCHRVALRLIERELNCEPREGQVRIFRGDHDPWYLGGAVVAASLGACASWYVGNPSYAIGAPLAVILPWLMMRSSIPREGLVVTKLSANYTRFDLRELLVMWAALLTYAIVTIPLMRRVEHDPALAKYYEESVGVFMGGLCAVVLSVAVVYGRKLEARKTAEERARAPVSEQRWRELVDNINTTA